MSPFAHCWWHSPPAWPVAAQRKASSRLRGGPTPACVESEQVVRFSAADGVQLTGALWGEGDVGIVLAHMYNGDLCQWRLYAPRLAERYQVLAFDFRCYSSRHPQPAGNIERDVVAAAAELRRRGARKVVLIGGPMGGAVVLEAATQMRPDGVVSLSAPIGASGVDGWWLSSDW